MKAAFWVPGNGRWKKQFFRHQSGKRPIFKNCSSSEQTRMRLSFFFFALIKTIKKLLFVRKKVFLQKKWAILPDIIIVLAWPSNVCKYPIFTLLIFWKKTSLKSDWSLTYLHFEKSNIFQKRSSQSKFFCWCQSPESLPPSVLFDFFIFCVQLKQRQTQFLSKLPSGAKNMKIKRYNPREQCSWVV